ncbi:putative signal transducing protein [Coraliomargarita sinensis]|nr:DUF2007 domain-containing protein [Coraliomargarita sinensis]
MPVIATYTKMEDAHLAVSQLQGSGVEAWLRDEATANLYWLYSNAIGGVKVEVAEEDIERAREVLELPKEESGLLQCPHCGSQNTSVRQMNLISALALIFLSLILPERKHKADCLDCGKSFDF